MIKIDHIVKALKDTSIIHPTTPVDNTVIDGFFDMCRSITDDINLQAIELNESTFDEFTDKLYLDDEIVELKKFCSSEELSLFLSDIG